MMNRIPVILDCDTGIDDAYALLVALKHPRLDVQGITCVAGNVVVSQTTENSIRICDLAKSDVPVYMGAEKPLRREQVVATHVHGQNGLGDIPLEAPSRPAEPLFAPDAIYELAKKNAGELVIIAVGPLTNLALAFLMHRDLPTLLKRIVIMGGAAIGGNATPCAEFNIYADAEAANIVFQSGVPVHMCGLDVTMKGYLTPEDVEELGRLGTKTGKFVRDMSQNVLVYSMSKGIPGMCMHDPIAVLQAAEEPFLTGYEAGVYVETRGSLTYGKTVTDLNSDKKFDERNAVVVMDIDREAMKKRIFELIALCD